MKLSWYAMRFCCPFILDSSDSSVLRKPSIWRCCSIENADSPMQDCGVSGASFDAGRLLRASSIGYPFWWWDLLLRHCGGEGLQPLVAVFILGHTCNFECPCAETVGYGSFLLGAIFRCHFYNSASQ